MGEARVAIFGAGKMGLPLACVIASRGAHVVACDPDEGKVSRINAGECPFEEPGVPELLHSEVAHGRLGATTDPRTALQDADVAIVIVPVLLREDRRADLSIITDVARSIAAHAPAKCLVCFETTLPVGATRRLAALMEQERGAAISVAFSPERVKSLHVLESLTKTPKIVGGINDEAAHRAETFYAQYLGAPVINVGSAEAAEMTKLADMIYRDVNIALANELAWYCADHGLDFGMIRDAANTSGESALLLPGIGVGGHCTPVYPWFLIRDGMWDSLTAFGRRINEQQPAEVLAQFEAQIGAFEGHRIAILGLGFRPGVKEHTCSPAFAIRDVLLSKGCDIKMHDPLYTSDEIRSHGFEPLDSIEGGWATILILNTAHAEYRHLHFQVLADAGSLPCWTDAICGIQPVSSPPGSTTWASEREAVRLAGRFCS
jgi:nucleotide sugar dehydrogenase